MGRELDHSYKNISCHSSGFYLTLQTLLAKENLVNCSLVSKLIGFQGAQLQMPSLVHQHKANPARLCTLILALQDHLTKFVLYPLTSRCLQEDIL
ncbi:hypothetical protein P7K49_009509 [Saguinus oedipus]|uniref:Uncharacterized protein n=1 Tax=Saguinus oedipus TaxID=9490 RepID=A0ABQ9VMG1_SAGOE|nr:hypothetical protein P7K49_009509 [Saguinus oedipus]